MDAPDLCTPAPLANSSATWRQGEPKTSSNGRMGGAARPANSTVLPAEQSAALRDRLVSEIAGLESQGSAVAWAREALPLKEHAHWNRRKNGGNRICPEAIRVLAISGRRTSPAAATSVVAQSSAEKMSLISMCGGTRPGQRMIAGCSTCAPTRSRRTARGRRLREMVYRPRLRARSSAVAGGAAYRELQTVPAATEAWLFLGGAGYGEAEESPVQQLIVKADA